MTKRRLPGSTDLSGEESTSRLKSSHDKVGKTKKNANGYDNDSDNDSDDDSDIDGDDDNDGWVIPHFI
jgi:hypothetical protein